MLQAAVNIGAEGRTRTGTSSYAQRILSLFTCLWKSLPVRDLQHPNLLPHNALYGNTLQYAASSLWTFSPIYGLKLG